MAADMVSDSAGGKMELDVVGHPEGQIETASTSECEPNPCETEAGAFNNNNNNKTPPPQKSDYLQDNDENTSVKENNIPMLKSDPQSIIRKTTVLFKPYLDEPHDSATKIDGTPTVMGEFSTMNSHDQSNASMVSILSHLYVTARLL